MAVLSHSWLGWFSEYVSKTNILSWGLLAASSQHCGRDPLQVVQVGEEEGWEGFWQKGLQGNICAKYIGSGFCRYMRP